MNRVVLFFSFAVGALACDNMVKEASKPVAATTPPPMAAQVPSAMPMPTSKVTKLDFSENDFVENDKSRDPFRFFVLGAAASGVARPVANQKKVVLPDNSIDELKLVAIVMSGDFPRAMVIDPGGKGWVLKRGDYVGRPDVVHVGGSGGSDYQLNWRVDRVRAEELVLLRDDPAQPGIPPATKVIPLHPEGEDQSKLGRN